MLSTRVGYAGGSTKDPTYRRIGDHTEVFQVDYDPKMVTFAQLLDVFWESHNPCAPAWSTQYKAILFYHEDEQKRVAEESAAKIAEKRGREITTEIVPLRKFHVAEDYHQKYSLRRHKRIVRDLEGIYGDKWQFSTAAARLNAYYAGDLDYETLRSLLAEVGLRAVGEHDPERIERAE